MEPKDYFKFALIECSYLNNERYWFLFIQNILDLLGYFCTTNNRFMDTYFKLKKKIRQHYHPSSNEELAVHNVLCTSFENKSMVDDIFQLSDTFCKPKINAILRGEKILVNSTNFGWCTFSPALHKIIKTVERKKCVRPDVTEKDIHITRWPEGKHYYLKIGEHDFGKFPSVQEAERVSKIKFEELIHDKKEG